MNYILTKINEYIEIHEGTLNEKIYHQVRIEYSLVLIFSYFWNKNFSFIETLKKKREIVHNLSKPTIGKLVELVKTLDLDNEIDSSDLDILLEYKEFRNIQIGHGFSMEDFLDNHIEAAINIFQGIDGIIKSLFGPKPLLVLVKSYDVEQELFQGVLLKPDGAKSRWTFRSAISNFKRGCLYIQSGLNTYKKISPFVHVDLPNKLYIFRGITDLIGGEISYNRIDESQFDYRKNWSDFLKDYPVTDGEKNYTNNGTYINVFENNYKSYINVKSIKSQVLEFLVGKKSRSTVAITIWGHGGVGKTALIQNICEYLSTDTEIVKGKKFKYILFLSAKDRKFNAETLQIDSIDDRSVTNFNDLILTINRLLFQTESVDIDNIVSIQSRVLLVIDDFETFSDIDKGKITDFIDLLDPAYHKVVITTRNRFLQIGKPIETNELDKNSSVKFLISIMDTRYNYGLQKLNRLENLIKESKFEDDLFRITTGRPLFLYAFAHILSQYGTDIKSLLAQDEVLHIASTPEATSFLYGRVYDQLGADPLAQQIFLVAGLVTPPTKLRSLVSHLRYVLNRVSDDTGFNVALRKLIDLRIVKVEDGFYYIYSDEILNIMKIKFDDYGKSVKGNFIQRYRDIERNIEYDTGKALLMNADSSRNSDQSEQFVVQKYGEIVRMKNLDMSIRKDALLRMADYLYNQRANKEQAVKKIKENGFLHDNLDVSKRLSLYLWSLGDDESKRESNNVLRNYIRRSKSGGLKINFDQKVHLQSLLVFRSYVYWTDQLTNGIDKAEYDTQIQNIYNSTGHLLYNSLLNCNIDSMTAEERQDVVTAIPHLCRVLSSVGKSDNSNKLIEHVLNTVKKLSPLNIQSISKLKGSKYHEINRPPPVTKWLDAVDVDKMHIGRVKYIDHEGGFVIMKSSKIGIDIFLHESNLLDGNFGQVTKGDLLEFLLEIDENSKPIVGEKSRLVAESAYVTW